MIPIPKERILPGLWYFNWTIAPIKTNTPSTMRRGAVSIIPKQRKSIPPIKPKIVLMIDKIFEIHISDETAEKRLVGRWNCKKCGIAYNIITSPKPKQKGICDVCGSSLFQRDDDTNHESIQKRLNIYHKDTQPVLEKYRNKVIKINGEQTIEKITQDILKKL